MRVGLALGSNQGHRLDYFLQARIRILALPGVKIPGTLCSPLYETEPVDCPPGSAPFLNTVMEVTAVDTLSPQELLTELRKIEMALGRPSRYPRNDPRPLDLDILYAGQLLLNTEALTLPHPRLTHRRFVLKPLAAIRPELILPGLHKPVAELLRELDDPAKVRQVAPCW